MRVITLIMFFLMAFLSTAEVVEKHFHYHLESAPSSRQLGSRREERRSKNKRFRLRLKRRLRKRCKRRCMLASKNRKCKKRCLAKLLFKEKTDRTNRCKNHWCSGKSGDEKKKCEEKCERKNLLKIYGLERRKCLRKCGGDHACKNECQKIGNEAPARRLVGRCLSGCAQIRGREQRRLCAVGCRGLE